MSALAVAPPPATSDGPAVAAFCANFIRQTKGRWARQPLIFEPWQRAFIDEAFELDADSGRRIYQEVILGIPKKNGKSTMGSSIGLYLLGMDGEQEPEVYAAAAAKGQAGIVMGQARSMVASSPALLDVFRVFRYHIECPENGGVFRVVSSDAALQQGINPSGNVIDELHAHKNGDLYTALTNASGAREEPMTVTITTAGDDEEGVLGRIYNRMMLLPNLERRGMLTIARDRENGVLMYWYGAPTGADIDDPEVWRGTNPASWLQDLAWLRRQRHKSTTRDRDFMRYHLNMWVPLEEAWLEPGMWERCRDDELKFDVRLPVGVGIDKSQTHDDTAVVAAQRQGNRVVVHARVWSNPFPPNHADHDTWKVPTADVMDYLRALRRQFPASAARDEKRRYAIPGPAFAYDPWGFAEAAEVLEHDGLNMVRFEQTTSNLGPASTTAYALIKDARLAHNGDPILARHVANTVGVKTERGWKVAKIRKATPKKNDACVGMVMGVAMAMQEAPSRGPERAAIPSAMGF